MMHNVKMAFSNKMADATLDSVFSARLKKNNFDITHFRKSGFDIKTAFNVLAYIFFLLYKDFYSLNLFSF